MHDRVDRPSTSTVQAPHSPSPQPILQPVKPRSSRKTSRSGRSREVSTVWVVPFTISVVSSDMETPPLKNGQPCANRLRTPCRIFHVNNPPVCGGGVVEQVS